MLTQTEEILPLVLYLQTQIEDASVQRRMKEWEVLLGSTPSPFFFSLASSILSASSESDKYRTKGDLVDLG